MPCPGGAAWNRRVMSAPVRKPTPETSAERAIVFCNRCFIRAPATVKRGCRGRRSRIPGCGRAPSSLSAFGGLEVLVLLLGGGALLRDGLRIAAGGRQTFIQVLDDAVGQIVALAVVDDDLVHELVHAVRIGAVEV